MIGSESPATIKYDHQGSKAQLWSLKKKCLRKTNGGQRYQYLFIGRYKSCFVKCHSKSNDKYKQDEIIQMLNFFIDNIFVLFWYSIGYELCSATRWYVSIHLWGRLPSFVYICIAVGDPIIKMWKVVIQSIDYSYTWISKVICLGLFYALWFEVIVHFVYWWNSWLSSIKLSFHNY